MCFTLQGATIAVIKITTPRVSRKQLLLITEFLPVTKKGKENRCPTYADLPSASSLVGQRPFLTMRAATLSGSFCSTACSSLSSLLLQSWLWGGQVREQVTTLNCPDGNWYHTAFFITYKTIDDWAALRNMQLECAITSDDVKKMLVFFAWDHQRDGSTNSYEIRVLEVTKTTFQKEIYIKKDG